MHLAANKKPKTQHGESTHAIEPEMIARDHNAEQRERWVQQRRLHDLDLTFALQKTSQGRNTKRCFEKPDKGVI
jgi:hypothetical protein